MINERDCCNKCYSGLRFLLYSKHLKIMLCFGKIYLENYITVVKMILFIFSFFFSISKCKYVHLPSQNPIWIAAPIAQLVRVEDS